MRANFVDMSILLSLVALEIMIKGLLYHDDDDKDSKRRRAHNILMNRFMQLSSQSAMYLNPIEFWGNTFGNVPPLNFLNNVRKTAVDAEMYLEGNDRLVSGPDAGKSRTFTQARKTFAPSPLRKGFGFGSSGDRQYNSSAFDKWFLNKNKKAQSKIRVAKINAQKKYLRNSLSDEETEKVTKQINKFYRKKEGEEYTDALGRIREGFKPE